MVVQWEVTSFAVHGADTVLFANGLMQVAVNVTIKAIDPTNNADYALTAAQLSTIELVDYYHTDQKLTGPWNYSTNENEFAHSMPAKSPGNTADHVVPGTAKLGNAQSQKYWVTTTKIESKRVAARILQPNDTLITTNSSQFNSSVELKGTAPVAYDMSNTNFQRYNTSGGGGLFDHWDQDNYYLTSKDSKFKFIKVQLHGRMPETDCQVGMRGCVSYHGSQGITRAIHYVWPMGPKTTKLMGVTHDRSCTPLPYNLSKNLVVNEYANAVCLTRLSIFALQEPWGNDWYYVERWFKVFDLYGNSGSFYMGSTNNGNLIDLRHHNPTKAAELLDKIVYVGEKPPLSDAGISEEVSLAKAMAIIKAVDGVETGEGIDLTKALEIIAADGAARAVAAVGTGRGLDLAKAKELIESIKAAETGEPIDIARAMEIIEIVDAAEFLEPGANATT